LYADGIKVLVIVSDWLMPGVKGDQFLIDVHQRYPSIMTVMLTGQADESAIERARQEAQLYACLRKPWSEEELASVISTALE
jgi:CheY-like chemotaxis protein